MASTALAPAPPGLGILTVTLVRHAQSEDNANGILAGHRDAPLSALGRAQARALGKGLQWQQLQAVYSSDLKRARETAGEIVEANQTVPAPTLVHTRALREQYFGVVEGRAWSDPDWTPPLPTDSRTHKYPQGESLEEVGARMRSAARRYILPRIESLRGGAEGEADGGHVVVVAHGVAIAELLRFFMSQHDTGSSSSSPWPDPKASYTRVRLENTGCTQVELAVPLGDHAASTSAASAAPDFDSSLASIPDSSAPARPLYVRIVEQNRIDHLKALTAAAALGNAPGGASNGAAGDDSFGDALGLSQGGPSSMTPGGPQANARAIGAYDVSFMVRELERTGGQSAMLSALGEHYDRDAGGANFASASTAAGQTVSPPSGSSQVTFGPGLSVSESPSTGSAALPSSMSAGSTSVSRDTLYHHGPLTGPGAASDAWQSVCVRVLPLFNGEGLKSPIEELNKSVQTHIVRTLDRSPARALDALSTDLAALVSTGAYTLNAKLQSVGHDDLRLVGRLVEIWTFFFGSVLPYIEGVFLPLQTDPVLVSLTTASDVGQSSSAAASTGGVGGTSSGAQSSAGIHTFSAGEPETPRKVPSAFQGLRTERIDVRTIALTVFRDRVVLPLYERLVALFSSIRELEGGASHTGARSASRGPGLRAQAVSVASEVGHVPSISTPGPVSTGMGSDSLSPRLLQMTMVLASVLSNDEAQAAMDSLFKALRLGSAAPATERETRTTQQYRGGEAGGRENRRGWLPRSAVKHGTQAAGNASTLDDDSEEWVSARAGFGFGMHQPPMASTSSLFAARSHQPMLSEDEYLTSLRSPTLASPPPQEGENGGTALSARLQGSTIDPELSDASDDDDEAAPAASMRGSQHGGPAPVQSYNSSHALSASDAVDDGAGSDTDDDADASLATPVQQTPARAAGAAARAPRTAAGQDASSPPGNSALRSAGHATPTVGLGLPLLDGPEAERPGATAQ